MSTSVFVNRQRSVLLGLGLVMLASMLAMVSGQGQNDAARKAMKKFEPYAGSFTFKGKLDMGVFGQPGVKIEFPGTAKNQMVLGGTGEISVAQTETQSIGYMGYRSDTNQYYYLGLDGNQTAISYMAGNFTRPDLMKLTDPTTQVTSETRYGKDGSSESTIRIPPEQAVMMEIRSTRVGKKTGDILKELTSGPVKPVRVNRKADNENPAENFSRSHLLLQKFCGDFTSNKGEKIASRMVGNGRYVLTHGTSPSESLSFMGYNNAGRFFQSMLVSPELPMPIYLQGNMKEDGSILLEDPFNPAGLKVQWTFGDDGGFSMTATMGGQVVDQKSWKKTE